MKAATMRAARSSLPSGEARSGIVTNALASAPSGPAARGKAGGGNSPRDVRFGTGRSDAPSRPQRRAGGAFAARGDHQRVNIDPRIAAAAAIGVEAQFAPVDGGCVELVRPDELPRLCRRGRASSLAIS